jgi:hypothetical protein
MVIGPCKRGQGTFWGDSGISKMGDWEGRGKVRRRALREGVGNEINMGSVVLEVFTGPQRESGSFIHFTNIDQEHVVLGCSSPSDRQDSHSDGAECL